MKERGSFLTLQCRMRCCFLYALESCRGSVPYSILDSVITCGDVCSTQKEHCRIRYKCPKCNVGLCIDTCFRVYHTKLQFWDQPHTWSGSHNHKYHLSLGTDNFWMSKYCYITGVMGFGFYERGKEISWDVFSYFCLIMAFCGWLKKEKMAALRKLRMCQDFTVF